MHIIRYRDHDGAVRIGTRAEGGIHPLAIGSMHELLGLPLDGVRALVGAGGPAVPADGVALLPPVDGPTEVWASGVTYLRSMDARVEESQEKDIYTRVYGAERPELFFKSPAWRVVGDGEPVSIRQDSASNVPEPELGIVLNALGELVGYVVCNDMSSRTIEGENPLYLPQAKMYAGACAMSSGIRPVWEVDGTELAIALSITREDREVFTGDTSTDRMARTFADLARYLFAAEHFPYGAIISTGTGIVPSLDFTLESGDVVTITIDGVGQLVNTVTVGKAAFAGMRATGATAERNIP
jgi:2-dehydro-3-deoxy-D-arabinonate dehydratase